MSYADRMKKQIAKSGESITLGGSSYIGVIKPLDSGIMRTYLDDVEVTAVVKPGLLLVVDYTVPIAVGNTITRDGRTFTVKKTFSHSLAGNIIAKTAVLY